MIEKEFVVDMRELIDDIKNKVNNNQLVVLKGEGVSMQPFITHKDLLTLQKAKSSKVKVGDVYLYKRVSGSYAIHRVYSKSKNYVYMLGDAQLYIEKVPKDCLVAVVSKVEKPDKIIDCTSFRVRTINAIRMKKRIFKVKYRRIVLDYNDKVRHQLSKIKKKLMKER